jgi:hypothetical protein
LPRCLSKQDLTKKPTEIVKANRARRPMIRKDPNGDMAQNFTLEGLAQGLAEIPPHLTSGAHLGNLLCSAGRGRWQTTPQAAIRPERWVVHPTEQKQAQDVAQNQQLTDADLACP